MRVWGTVHGRESYVETETEADGIARLAELDREPVHAPVARQRVCIRCGAPATMSASMGPACADCYDDLAD